MIGNIYYVFGGLLILALLKILMSFKSFYKIGEWQTKFQKVTNKKPLKCGFLFRYLNHINDHVCARENLHFYGNVNNFRIVHNIHRSYLQASSEIAEEGKT